MHQASSSKQVCFWRRASSSNARQAALGWTLQAQRTTRTAAERTTQAELHGRLIESAFKPGVAPFQQPQPNSKANGDAFVKEGPSYLRSSYKAVIMSSASFAHGGYPPLPSAIPDPSLDDSYEIVYEDYSGEHLLPEIVSLIEKELRCVV